VQTLPGQGLVVMAATFSPDGQRLAISSLRNGLVDYPLEMTPAEIAVWDMTTRSQLESIRLMESTSLAFRADGQALLACGNAVKELALDGTHQLRLVANTVGSQAEYGPGDVAAVLTEPDGIEYVPFQDQSRRFATGLIYPGFDVSPDGQLIATSGAALWRASDRSIVWAGDAAALSAAPPTYAPPADNWVRFSPDGLTFLVSDFAGLTDPPWGHPPALTAPYTTSTTVLRTSDGMQRILHADFARRPVFSPDGAWIIAGNMAYPLATANAVYLPLDRSFAAVSAISRDGTIAVAREDGVVQLFCSGPLP
jgi:hypothetical protein